MTFGSVAEFYADMVKQAESLGLSYPVAVACDAATVGLQAFVLVPERVQPGMMESAFRAVVMEIRHQTRLSEDERVRMDSFLEAMRKRYKIR